MEANDKWNSSYDYLTDVRKRNHTDSEAENSNPHYSSHGEPTTEPAIKRVRAEHYSEEYPFVYCLHGVFCEGATGGHQHTQHAQLALYEDCPRLFEGDDKVSQLRGTRFVSYSFRVPADATIVIYKTYSCTDYLSQQDNLFQQIPLPRLQEQFLRANKARFYCLSITGPEAIPSSVQIKLQPNELLDEMRQVLSHSPILRDWDLGESLSFPFPFYFHHKETFRQAVASLGGAALQQWTAVFLKCINELCAWDHREAHELFSQGGIDEKHFSKLFRIDDVIVAPRDNIHRTYKISRIRPSQEGDTVSLECWSYDFDGTFQKRPAKLSATRPSGQGPVSINTLEAFPLRLDLTDMHKRLAERGEKFWKCRERKYVCYTAPRLPFESQTAQQRFMVDHAMYKLLHQESHADQTPGTVNSDGKQTISIKDLEDLPDTERSLEMLLFPAQLKGFGLHDKKWRTLLVDYIEEIEWNKDAFKQLVLQKDKKDLVKALVTVHLKTRKGVDLIEGKGNGLIILLHGGPGTGKTLTAESVAEIAERPLYRVTCGDMGIDPEGVEKYLDSVLHIGTVWNCVVLLDEADIFLERRTTEDIKRNALVSVFLRVLEYYDGILVVTTNRVGLFDEAFKSRIQISIHYPALDEDARRRVWLSAIRAIPGGQVKYDSEDLCQRAPDLAKNKLNGRQIRNTVHCAMQLAISNNEQLEDSHFQTVIGITMEFERLIQDVHGKDDDAVARDEEIR